MSKKNIVLLKNIDDLEKVFRCQEGSPYETIYLRELSDGVLTTMRKKLEMEKLMGHRTGNYRGHILCESKVPLVNKSCIRLHTGLR